MVSRFRVSLVLGLYLISASAEARTSPDASAVDDGAGYKIVIIEQQQNHPLGAGVDTGFGDAVEFSKTYPLIASPLTQDANAFNAKIRTMLPKWWNGPSDNTQKSDPDTDITLVCQPTGEPPPVDGKSPDAGGMLPGVISMACMNDRYRHGALHGGGRYWGFNWLVDARRRLKASDVFAPGTAWKTPLAALLDADRNANGTPAVPLRPLNVADPGHWVVARNGLGFIYAYAEFFGAEDGGAGAFDLIPWSKLRPYLNPHGIVPRQDWNLPLPDNS